MLNGKRALRKNGPETSKVHGQTTRGRKISDVRLHSKRRSNPSLGKKSSSPFKTFHHETKSSLASMEVLHTENSALKTRVSVLKRELCRLRSNSKPSSKTTEKPRSSATVSRLKATLVDLKAQLRQKDEEIFKLKYLRTRQGLNRHRPSQAEIKELLTEIEDRNRVIVEMFDKRGVVPTWFERLRQYLTERQLTIFQFVSSMQTQNKVSLPTLVAAVGTPRDAADVLDVLPASLPAEVFVKLFAASPEASTSAVEVSKTLKHIAMRMQLYRIPKDQLTFTLFGESYHPNKMLSEDVLKEHLRQPPFKVVCPHKANGLVRHLVGSSKQTSAETLVSALSGSLEDWRIFSTEEEEEFDKLLFEVVSANMLELKKLWARRDTTHTGLVPLSDFFKAFETLGVSQSPEVQQYVALLFYSYSYDFLQAPYLHFLKTYTQPIEEIDDEERTLLVKKYLEVIARTMAKESRSTRSTFVDVNGLVYPETFIKGLRDIGLGDLDEDTVIMIIEALQHDSKQERMCIKADDLEEILECFGVSRETEKTFESEKSIESVIIRNDSSIEVTDREYHL